MQYYFNELSPEKFQRLINVILTARFGEKARLTPLRGSDGGRDGETAFDQPGQEFIEFQLPAVTRPRSPFIAPEPGRYLFQVKHHRTNESRPQDSRAKVVSDFGEELTGNVLSRSGDERVNFFYLITNVSSSEEAMVKIDDRKRVLTPRARPLFADVWWQEQIVAFLDQMPSLWAAYPELFAGGVVPLLGQIATLQPKGIPLAIRLALSKQTNRDKQIKFRQIDLQRDLAALFVDLDVALGALDKSTRIDLLGSHGRQHLFDMRQHGLHQEAQVEMESSEAESDEEDLIFDMVDYDEETDEPHLSALWLLLNESSHCARKIILEGGPGQGKSTITQMAAQIYRENLLAPQFPMKAEGRWQSPEKSRLVLRLELRDFAEWFRSKSAEEKDTEAGSVEEFLSKELQREAGGATVTVEDIHGLAGATPLLLIFDGLDEVASDELRDRTLARIDDCVARLEQAEADLRVIVTTRPPAIAGRGERLSEFHRFTLSPLSARRIEEYLQRWLAVQAPEEDESRRIRNAYLNRRADDYVQALARNPMQLSVLLHFIRLKGEAFPSQRAELYRDYFQVVIDRDVEKNSYLRDHRKLIEELHGVLAFRIHALTETEQADRSLAYPQLLKIVRSWLHKQGESEDMAESLFKVGNERLGLVVALRGEGHDTRYGFSIQPIQEYFAAAFINEHFALDKAHSLFEEMARRPYWQEVALFLGGLRRSTEKADLLARCKQLDDPNVVPWRGNGYITALRMLQDGILSQRHLAADALDFLLDLYDSNSTTAQSDILDTFGNTLISIEKLLPYGRKEQHIKRIESIFLTLWERSDLSQFRNRLYCLAHLLLHAQDEQETVQFLESIEAKTATQFRMLPYLRLTVPLALELPVEGRDSFPDDLSSELWSSGQGNLNTKRWASAWWTGRARASGVVAPEEFHQALAYEFAINPLHDARIMGLSSCKPLSSWAIWHLVALNNFLSLQTFRQFPAKEWNRISSEIKPNSCDIELNYDGLEPATAHAIKDLIAICCACAACLQSEFSDDNGFVETDLEDDYEANRYSDLPSADEEVREDNQTTRFAHLEEVVFSHLDTLQKLLQEPEHIGWMAALIGATLFRTVFFNYRGSHALMSAEHADDFQNIFNIRPECMALWKMLRPYYDVNWDKLQIEFSGEIGDDLRRFLFEGRYHGRSPLRVRTDEQDLRLVTDVFRQQALSLEENDRGQSSWISTIPLELEHIGAFFCIETDDATTIKQLLQFLGSSSTTSIGKRGFADSLPQDLVDLIISIMREDDDANLWRGAFIALSGSNYVSNLTVEELLRIIGSAKRRGVEVQMLFNRHHAQIRNSSEHGSSFEKLIEVAQKICELRNTFDSETVRTASQFLSSNIPVDLAPLSKKIEQEQML